MVEPSNTGGGRKSLRLQVLLSVALAQALVLVWLIRQDPLLAASLRKYLPLPSRAVAAAPKTDFSRDPPPGTAFEIKPSYTGIQRLSVKPRGYLLVAVNDCAGCLSLDLKSTQTDCRAAGLELALLTLAKHSKAAQFRKDAGVEAPVVFDPKLEIAKRLNVLWMGRAYLLSADGRLAWACREHSPSYNPFKDNAFRKALEGLKP